jgi:hypothetical protein
VQNISQNYADSKPVILHKQTLFYGGWFFKEIGMPGLEEEKLKYFHMRFNIVNKKYKFNTA